MAASRQSEENQCSSHSYSSLCLGLWASPGQGPSSMRTQQGSRAALTVPYANPVQQAGLPRRHLREPSKEAGLLSPSSTRPQCNGPGSLTVIYANPARKTSSSHRHLREPSATSRAPSPSSTRTQRGSRAAIICLYAGLPHRHLREPSQEAGLLSPSYTRPLFNGPGSPTVIYTSPGPTKTEGLRDPTRRWARGPLPALPPPGLVSRVQGGRASTSCNLEA